MERSAAWRGAAGYATVFPQAIGMAATWDAPLIHEEGRVIGIEGKGEIQLRDSGGQSLHFLWHGFLVAEREHLSRSALGAGAGTYGEDPFLTGRIGNGSLSAACRETIPTIIWRLRRRNTSMCTAARKRSGTA